MAGYLLDTNHLSAAIRRVSPVRDRIRRTIRDGVRVGTTNSGPPPGRCGPCRTPKASRSSLDMVAVDDEMDPGHAEIRGTEPGKLSSSASRALKKLFRLADPTGTFREES